MVNPLLHTKMTQIKTFINADDKDINKFIEKVKVIQIIKNIEERNIYTTILYEEKY